MQIDHSQFTVYLGYSAHSVDFAFKLAADLKNHGINLWMELMSATAETNSQSTFQYAMESCAAVLVIIDEDTPSNVDWEALSTSPESEAKKLTPLLLASPDNTYESALDFRSWHNEYVYQAQLNKLLTHLNDRIPETERHLPDANTRHINYLIAEIKQYRALLELMSPPTTASPSDKSDKRAIYAQSMWGLTGAFEVSDNDAEQSVSTYQFPEIQSLHQAFVLAGKSGTGKTTTLYRALLDTLRAYQANPEETPLPMLLHLGAWADEENIETFIRARWPYAEDPIVTFSQGTMTLFLDGLDEIGEAADTRIESLREWLNGENAPRNIVIACNSEQPHYQQLDLPVVTLQEINTARVKQYVMNHLDGDIATDLLKELLPEDEHTGRDNVFVHIARNALLLAIIVTIRQHDPKATIPQHRAPLLHELLNHLWAHRIVTTNHAELEEIVPALSRLACAMIDDGTPTYVPYDYALQAAGDENALQAALDARIMIMRDEQVGFTHQWLRDLIATHHLVRYEGIYSRLMRAQFDEDGARIPWKWDHAIILSSGLADAFGHEGDTDRILAEVAEVNPYLALECIASGVTISDEVREEIIAHLLAFTRSIDPAYLPKILRVMEGTTDSNTVSALLEHLHSDSPPLQQPGAESEESIMPLKKFGTDTLRFLMEILRGEKWQRRRGAAWALGELQEPAAVPSLVEALLDENEDVRREASYALARIGRPALPRLLKSLYHNNPDMRAAAIKVLGHIGDASAVPDLIACLPDTDWPEMEEARICDLAAIALEYIGTDDALAAVDAWRHGGKSTAQNQKLHAKIRNGRPPGVIDQKSSEQLLADLNSEDWTARRDAIRKLGTKQDETLIPEILAALNDEDSQVRWTAVKAVSGFDSEEIISALLECLHDEDCLVCDAAGEALSGMGAAAIPGLINVLKVESADVRSAAATALGQIGDESAIPHLVDLLEDINTPRWDDTPVNVAAATALEQIGTEKALFALGQWRRDLQARESQPNPNQDTNTPLLILDDIAHTYDDDVQHREALLNFLDALEAGGWRGQQEAARALREYAKTLKGANDLAAIEKLSHALENDEVLVRWGAAEALAWAGHIQAAPALLEALNDESFTVRIAAVRALSAIEAKDAVPGLLGALEDKHHLVREAAAETLGILGDPVAASHLVKTLQDEDAFVRRAATEALGEIRVADTLPELLTVLHDDEVLVRWAGVEALRKLNDSRAVPALIECLEDTSSPSWEDNRLCDLAAVALEALGTETAQDALQAWRNRLHS